MAFTIEIMPSALAELKTVKVFHRRAIVEAIDEQLAHQPLVETKNRKPLPGADATFEFDPLFGNFASESTAFFTMSTKSSQWYS